MWFYSRTQTPSLATQLPREVLSTIIKLSRPDNRQDNKEPLLAREDWNAFVALSLVHSSWLPCARRELCAVVTIRSGTQARQFLAAVSVDPGRVVLAKIRSLVLDDRDGAADGVHQGTLMRILDVCPYLRALRIVGQTRTTALSAATLTFGAAQPRLPLLRTFEYAPTGDIAPCHLFHVRNWISSFPQLRDLSITNGVFGSITTPFPSNSIVRMSFAGCTFRPEGLASLLVSAARSLKELSLSWCEVSGPDSGRVLAVFRDIGRTLEALVFRQITWHGQGGSDNFWACVAACSNVTTLGIQSDELVDHAPNFNFPNVTHLQLGFDTINDLDEEHPFFDSCLSRIWPEHASPSTSPSPSSSPGALPATRTCALWLPLTCTLAAERWQGAAQKLELLQRRGIDLYIVFTGESGHERWYPAAAVVLAMDSSLEGFPEPKTLLPTALQVKRHPRALPTLNWDEALEISAANYLLIDSSAAVVVGQAPTLRIKVNRDTSMRAVLNGVCAHHNLNATVETLWYRNQQVNLDQTAEDLELSRDARLGLRQPEAHIEPEDALRLFVRHDPSGALIELVVEREAFIDQLRRSCAKYLGPFPEGTILTMTLLVGAREVVLDTEYLEGIVSDDEELDLRVTTVAPNEVAGEETEGESDWPDTSILSRWWRMLSG